MKFIYTIDNENNAKRLGATNENYLTVEQEDFLIKEEHPDCKALLKWSEELGVHWEYVPIPPSEHREKAYETEHNIEWGGEMLTVDEANKLWAAYSAESNARATELGMLIAEAKAEIRERYPNEPIESDGDDDVENA